MIDEQFSGAGNAGRPMLLEGGLDWKEMSLNPKDMEFLEGKHSAARDIALAFGVPPQLLGIPGDNTYSNYERGQARLLDGHRPAAARLDRWTRFNRWLTPLYGDDLFLWYDEEMIPALEPLRQAEGRADQRRRLHDDQREAPGDGPGRRGRRGRDPRPVRRHPAGTGREIDLPSRAARRRPGRRGDRRDIVTARPGARPIGSRGDAGRHGGLDAARGSTREAR